MFLKPKMLQTRAESHSLLFWVSLREAAYPLRPIIDAEGDPSRGRSGGGVGCDVIHGETRELTGDFKHVELGAEVERGAEDL